MKKVICLFTVLLFVFSSFACDIFDKNEEISSFSWNETKEYYNSDIWGVKTSGFKNTSEKIIENSSDAILYAKSEVTVEYNMIQVSFDKDEEIWEVDFGKRNTLGGGQTVYLSRKGITQLIVYEE